MLTLEKLKTFKTVLEDTKVQLDELLRVRTQEKLFYNANDYNKSLISCQYCPQDYYSFRLFDTLVQLHFNRRTKQFYINIESLKYDFYKSVSFLDYISQNKLQQNKLKDTAYYIQSDIPFEECVKHFLNVCYLIIGFYINNNNSMFIYL